jgi:hypothetical protein
MLSPGERGGGAVAARPNGEFSQLGELLHD